jgi:hypothetical protein
MIKLNNKVKLLIFLLLLGHSILYNLTINNSPILSGIISTQKVNQITEYNNLLNYLFDNNYYNRFKQSDTYKNKKCQISQLNIWDDDIKKLLKQIPVYNNCKNHTPLTYILEKKLYINQTVNQTYYFGNVKKCEFAPIIRSSIEKESYIKGEYKKFSDGLEIIDDEIQVQCSDNKKYIYEYVHSILHRKNKNFENLINDKLNVLIIIFDSVSSSSFKRSLPNSLEYLKTFDNFYLFEKHHTTGQNTLPNLVPMLSNLNHEKLLVNEKILPFDDFPFIWKNFSEK